jgi:hypothetical protein
MATLFLCGGLQSSGSTLISWCFLQRPDLNGVLDAENDLLPTLVPQSPRDLAWYKTTISCFRLSELAQHFQDCGWEVRPLLVLRDVREVWASLLHKPYARNGITAEDPPLRWRLRRFLWDWELFRRRGWPMLRYEKFLIEPEKVLRKSCAELGLAWDRSMLDWPKEPDDIAYAENGNKTFWMTRGNNLTETLACHADRIDRAGTDRTGISNDDWNWLESEFRTFNMENHYPISVEAPQGAINPAKSSAPSFEVTRRYDWETQKRPLRWLLSTLGISNQSLVKRRSVRKVA